MGDEDINMQLTVDCMLQQGQGQAPWNWMLRAVHLLFPLAGLAFPLVLVSCLDPSKHLQLFLPST